MNFKESVTKFKNCRAVNVLKDVFNCRFFPFVTGAVVLLCYYLGWDMVTIYYMGLCGIAVVLLLDDVTPLFTLFVFMNVMISTKNSPSLVVGASDFYNQPAVIAQIAVLIALYVAAIIWKIALSIKDKRFKISPLFIGFAVFVVALMFNGAFYAEYKALDFVYGLFLAFLFLGVFVLISGNIKVTQKTFESIALSFVALSMLLVVELAVKYATTENLIVNGVVYKGAIVFGWGVHNTMGMLFSMSIPSILYLAGKYKHGWLLTPYAFIVLVAMFMTMSRQAMIGGSIAFVLASILLLIKGKNKIANACVFCGVAIALAIFCTVKWDKISTLYATILNNFTNTSGRTELYAIAMENFKAYPIFGVGFYIDLALDPGWAGLDIIPLMYHNTYMQLLGACGAVGLLTYAVHRTQTVICYIKNITVERTYIAITILALLIVNLFDNHLFYLLPTMLYGCLVAVLAASEKKNTQGL